MNLEKVQHATAPSAASRVSQAIWRWWETGTERPGRGDGCRRRRRALSEACVAAGAGLLLLLVFGKPIVAAVVFGIAAAVAIGGLWVPALYRGFKRAGHWLGRAVGAGLTWLLLAPFFYACFTTGRLFRILLHKDPLCRGFPTDRETYWVPHGPMSDPTHYTRQY